MCLKNSSKTLHMSPVAAKITKISVILIVFYFAECAAGSCISYGHACWGGHGKRSDNKNFDEQSMGNFQKHIPSPKWFLTRLLQDSSQTRPWRTIVPSVRNEREPYDDIDMDFSNLRNNQDLIEVPDQIVNADDLLYREDFGKNKNFNTEKKRSYTEATGKVI